MDTKTYNITKLNGNNYFLWRLKIEMLLQKEKVWNVVIEDTPAAPTDEWRSKDQSARATIGLTIEDKILYTTAHCQTSKQIWNFLRTTYEHKGLASKLFLLKRLYGIKYHEYPSMEEYLNEIQEVVQRLRVIGEEVKESHLIAIMLCGLPEKFNSIITALETREEDKLKADYVIEKLRGEARRQESTKDENNQISLAYNTNQYTARRSVICHVCNQAGHIRRNCPELRKKEEKKTGVWENPNRNSYLTRDRRTENTEAATNYYGNEETNEDYRDWAMKGTEKFTGDSEGDWIIDSGASSHMSPHIENFRNVSILKRPIEIEVASGKTILATHQGKVNINNNYDESLCLENVLYVPDIKTQLLSVPSLCSNKYRVLFDPEKCEIFKDNILCMRGRRSEKCYVISKESALLGKAYLTQPCIHTWHARMGHRSVNNIKSCIKRDSLSDFHIVKCTHPDFCDSCQIGGMTQTSFLTAKNHCSLPFKGLVTDLCGPISPVTFGNNSYFMAITDDHSNFTHVNLLKSKSEAAYYIIQFLKEGFNQFNYMPQFIRTDEGGEFKGKELELFLQNHGIKQQTSVAYAHPQNGKAERKNRTLVTMARSMLHSAGLPLGLWGEAILTAAYVLNRLPHSLNVKTPYQMWSGIKPSVKHLRTFGSLAYSWIPKQKRSKLDEVATKGIMVGYGIQKKCFRIWIPGTKQIINSISVNFNETKNLTSLKSEYKQDQLDIKLDCDAETELEKYPLTETPRRSLRENKGIPPNKLTY